MITANHFLVGAGALAALFGAAYLFKLNRLSSELETETSVAIHKINLEGISLRIDVTLKNPSGASVKVKQPFVKLIYGTTTVASSQVRDVNITLTKYSEVTTEPVMITLGFVNLAMSVPALLREYRQTGKLIMMIKTVTTINDSLPYSKTDTVTLGAGKEA